MCELTIDEYRRKKVPLWWRLCRRSRRLSDLDKSARRFFAQPVPIWIAYFLMLVFVFAVGWVNVLVGGVRG